MAHLIKRFQLISPYNLGRQVMSVLGRAMLINLVVFTAGATFFVYRAEGLSWQGRQGEAARSAAGAVATVLQHAQDPLAVISIFKVDILKLHREELVHLLEQNSILEEVIRVDANGVVLLEAHRDSSMLANLITIPQSQWFLDARSGRSYLGPLQMSFDGLPYLLIARPAPDGGAVAALVQMRALWGAVADIRFGAAGRAYVITREGDIVAHTDPKVVFANVSISGRPELAALLKAPNTEWHGAYLNFEGVSVVGATASIPGTNWVVVTELPQTEAFAASRAALLMLGGGLLILTLVTMQGVAQAIEHIIIRPMARLREGADRVGQGNLNHRIGLTGRDEISQFAQAFDEMADRLRERNAQVSANMAALQISEARYRAIVEDQTELICRYLPDGTLTFVNEAYCRYFGQTREALVGRSYVPLILEEDQPLVANFVAQLGRGNSLAVIEHRVILPDGSIRWQHWTDRAVMDAQGQFAEFQAVGRDITERKLAESALSASEERLRRITDHMLDVISQINVEGVIQYASPSHRWVLGLDVDVVIGRLIFERLHPDDLTPALLALGQALADNATSATVTFRYQHADGRYLWMECIGNLLYDAQGQPTGAVLCSRDITARKQMEEAIRESEQRYRLLAENATDIIWLCDLNLQMTYISPSVAKLRGWSVEEALTQSVPEILTPASATQAQMFFAEIMLQAAGAAPEELRSQSRSLDLEMARKDGSTVWTESQMSLLLDEQGRPAGILGVTRDISERRQAAEELRRVNTDLERRVQERTVELVRVNADLMAEVAERQRAEAALRESETRLRRITDNMLDLIVQVDAYGTYRYASPSHRSVMGYADEDLVGRPMYELIHPDDTAQVLAVAQQVSATGAASQIKVRCRHADGHYVWLESVGNPLLDEAGTVVGAIIASRDITQRQQAEELLRQAEAKYRMLVENIPVVVYIDVVDLTLPNGYRTIYVSPQITALLGYAPEDFFQSPSFWPNCVHPEDRAEELAVDKQHYLSGAPLTHEYRMLRRDGRVVWVHDEAILLQDFEGRFTYSQGVLFDISERKQAEERLKESLREKEVLLKEIHHRVKNNLQIISSLLNLQSNLVSDRRVLELLRDSQNRVRSMALVHEKLYRSPDLARIDFAEYLRNLTAQLARTYAGEAPGIEVKTQTAAVWLDVDTAMPCGLIVNELVSNALKHAFPDGRIGQICVSLLCGEARQVTLRVSDDGVGFPLDVDFRNTPSLGLQLVNTLAGQIGGTVELERQPETVFKIVFTPPDLDEKR